MTLARNAKLGLGTCCLAIGLFLGGCGDGTTAADAAESDATASTDTATGPEDTTVAGDTATPPEDTAVVDPCDPNPCLNGGTCAADGDNATCSCADGFEGDLCETEVQKTPCEFHCEGIVAAGCDNPPLPNEAACAVLCGQLTADPACGALFESVVGCMDDSNAWMCIPSDPTDADSPTSFAPGKAECQQPFFAWYQCTQMGDACTSYCDAATANCTDDNAIDFGDAGCFNTCIGWAPGAEDDTSGATLACRMYHVSVAGQQDPEVHCPHASPEGGGVCIPTLCETYCATLDDHCTDDNSVDFGDSDCLTTCGGWAVGDEGDTDGDTTECRLYHAQAAANDAALHCPHASVDGGGVCVASECDIYCETVQANCADENTISFGDVDCQTACGGWKSGDEGDIDGDSVACRTYHAEAAADDAALHCPHASVDGGGVCVDPPQACEVEYGSCDLGTPITEGLTCVLGLGEQGVCRRACTSEDLANCLDGETCITDELEAGFCGPETCAGFYTDDCGPGAHCIVLGGNGTCYQAGSTPEGEPCEQLLECQTHLMCDTVCVAPECSSDNIKTCPGENDFCNYYSIMLQEGTFTFDIGDCVAGCKPFVDASGCAEGEHCVAELQYPLVGQCEPLGDNPIGSGGECDGSISCVADHMCVDSTCQPVCAVGQGFGEDGGYCDAGEVCVALKMDGAAIGICQATCDYHANITCPGEDQWCSASELTGGVTDICFGEQSFWAQPGDVCPANVPEFSYCAENAFCFNHATVLGGAPNVECTKACFTSEGDFGPGHPECAEFLNTECTEVLPTGGFGVCIPVAP